MALTRGEKKVNLPISADFQRLGTQQKSTNIFNAAKQVIEPLMELEAAKQEIDMQLLENNSKERISTYNYALDKDRNIKRTLNALSDAEKKAAAKAAKTKADYERKIQDANNKNYVNSMKALINKDINLKVAELSLQFPADPKGYKDAIEAWANGYVSNKEFPKQLTDPDGVLIGDFQQEFDLKLQAAYLPHFTSAVKAANKIHATESLATFKLSYESGLNNSLQYINQLGDGLDIPTDPVDVMLQDMWGTIEFDKQLEKRDVAGNFAAQMELVMSPLYQQYEEYAAQLTNLAQLHPTLYDMADVMTELESQRTLLDSHVVGAFAKYWISGNPADRDKELAYAMGFINSWWNGEFVNSKSGAAYYVDTFTSPEHTAAAKDKIRAFAEKQVKAKYDRSKLGYSEIVDNKNQNNKMTIARWNGDGIGSLNDMTAAFIYPNKAEIEAAYTTWKGDGTSKTDDIKVQETLNKIAVNKQLKDDFNLFREGEITWDQVLGRNHEYSTNHQEIVDAFYFNTLQAEIDGSEIINRAAAISESGGIITDDRVLANFQLAYSKTNQYPTSFTNAVKSMGIISPENEDQMQRFKGVIAMVNTFGNGGLDGDLYMAFTDANRILAGGNVTDAVNRFNRYFEPNKFEEKDIINMVSSWDQDNMWLSSRIAEINDTMSDQRDWIWSVEAWQQIMLPNNRFIDLESVMLDYKYEIENKNFIDYGNNNSGWWTWSASTIREALDSNSAVINQMVREEMETMLMNRDQGVFDQEGMEKLAEAAMFNVYRKIQGNEWSFENFMFDNTKHNSYGPLLTTDGIQQHTGWDYEHLRSNSIIEIMAMTNAMTFEESEDFWGVTDYGAKLDDLNNMFESGQIKFKFDERSRYTNIPQWHIMIDVSGEGEWKELRNPENYSYSWSPSGSLLTNQNAASVESIKRKVIAENTNERLSSIYETRITDDGTKELWTYIGKSRGTAGYAGKMDENGWVKVESGMVGENDIQMINAINGFVATIGNNIERFKDVFQDWDDVDTWVEIANKNQQKVALEIANKKQEIENPDPIQSKNKFSAMSIQLDVPHQNRVGNNFYVFEHKYVDEMKNIQSVKAIGPNLVLNENGIGQLRNMGYNNDEIQKLIDGEIGIPSHHYEKLLDEKYNQAQGQYDDLYGNVIITPLQREVLIDLIANLGLEFAGLDSAIYEYIQEGNDYGVFNELKRLEPYYANKQRHSYHVNMWGAKSQGKYKF